MLNSVCSDRDLGLFDRLLFALTAVAIVGIILAYYINPPVDFGYRDRGIYFATQAGSAAIAFR